MKLVSFANLNFLLRILIRKRIATAIDSGAYLERKSEIYLDIEVLVSIPEFWDELKFWHGGYSYFKFYFQANNVTSKHLQNVDGMHTFQ